VPVWFRHQRVWRTPLRMDRLNLQRAPLPTRNAVFVVDNDPSMRRGIMWLLRMHGFKSKLFDSANAILRHDDFSAVLCVILDIDLDGESGIGVCRRLANRGIRLPVIFITGNDSEATRAAATKTGCIAYLTKPFPALALIEPVRRVRAATT
jgi:FixJ family two-component response regulator